MRFVRCLTRREQGCGRTCAAKTLYQRPVPTERNDLAAVTRSQSGLLAKNRHDKLLRKLPVSQQHRPRKPTKQIGFDGESYKQHGMFLPTPFAPLLESIAEAFQSQDSKQRQLRSYIAISKLHIIQARGHAAGLRKVLDRRRQDLF